MSGDSEIGAQQLLAEDDPVFGVAVRSPTNWTKAEARLGLRQLRRRLTEADAESWAASLSTFANPTVAAGGRVVIYDALPDEVNLAPLIASFTDPARQLVWTRTPDEGFDLTLHPWGSPTERASYGYLQPHVDAPIVADSEIGVVLVPALAFDRSGNRLGRGAGYYDRLLARLRPHAAMVGMTAGLIIDSLPVEEHDIAMTHLAGPEAVVAVPADPAS